MSELSLYFTSHPFLYAANFECENGPLFWQKDLPHFVGMVKQENQFYYDKKVWIEKQVYPSGEYTVYSWVKDARAIDPKYHDGGHRQGRRINLIEGVVIKGDHPNLPITSQFIEEVHQGLMPHFEAFFPMTLEEFNAHRASERWYNTQTFQFPAHVPDGHTPITEENIGKLPTQDFVKSEEQRSIKKNADQKTKEEKERAISLNYPREKAGEKTPTARHKPKITDQNILDLLENIDTLLPIEKKQIKSLIKLRDKINHAEPLVFSNNEEERRNHKMKIDQSFIQASNLLSNLKRRVSEAIGKTKHPQQEKDSRKNYSHHPSVFEAIFEFAHHAGDFILGDPRKDYYNKDNQNNFKMSRTIGLEAIVDYIDFIHGEMLGSPHKKEVLNRWYHELSTTNPKKNNEKTDISC